MHSGGGSSHAGGHEKLSFLRKTCEELLNLTAEVLEDRASFLQPTRIRSHSRSSAYPCRATCRNRRNLSVRSTHSSSKKVGMDGSEGWQNRSSSLTCHRSPEGGSFPRNLRIRFRMFSIPRYSAPINLAAAARPRRFGGSPSKSCCRASISFTTCHFPDRPSLHPLDCQVRGRERALGHSPHCQTPPSG